MALIQLTIISKLFDFVSFIIHQYLRVAVDPGGLNLAWPYAHFTPNLGQFVPQDIFFFLTGRYSETTIIKCFHN